MKKTFFQLHIGFFATLLIFVTGILIGIFVIVCTIIENFQPNILFIGVGIGWIIISVIPIYRCVYNRTIFYDNKIVITGEKLPPSYRNQFQDEIIISQIKDVRIVISNKNSKKEFTDLNLNSCETRRTYFEFEMENGEKKWMFIYYFSKKQRKEMLRILSEKTGKNLDYDELFKNRLDLYEKPPRSFWHKV